MKNIIVGDRVRVSAHATGNGLSRIGIVDAIYPDLGTTLVSISFIDDINSESEYFAAVRDPDTGFNEHMKVICGHY